MKQKAIHQLFLLVTIIFLSFCGCGESEKKSDTLTTEYLSGLNKNTDLNKIEISPNVILSPGFETVKKVYTGSVSNSVEEIQITPTIANRFSTMKINGISIEDGATSEALQLMAGEYNYNEIEITAESGDSSSYRFSIFRSSFSDNTALESLEVSEGEFQSPFTETPDGPWTVNIPYETTDIFITPTAVDANATITVNGNAPSVAVTLSGRTKSVKIIVTAEDASISKQYNLVLIPGAPVPSSVVTLNSIDLSNGTSINTTTNSNGPWTATVGTSVSEITITPEKGEVHQAITINGNSSPVSVGLNPGENPVSILVTAEDGTAKTYVLTITRELSSDTSLSELTIDTTRNYSMTPEFTVDKDGPWTIYFAGFDAPASFTVTSAATDNNAVLSIGETGSAGSSSPAAFSVDAGSEKTIEISVTAANGDTASYELTAVHRGDTGLDENNDLGALAISPGSLDQTFQANNLNYTATVLSSVGTITVTASKAAGHDSQVVSINGQSSPAEIELPDATNIITITNTAENLSSKDYTLTVTRELSDNANLSGLVVSETQSGSGLTLTPVFNTGVIDYSVTVPAVTTILFITPTLEDVRSTIHVNGTEVGNNAPIEVTIPEDNTIAIIVTPENGGQTKNYTINVDKLAPVNTDLKTLSVSSGTLTPAFTPGSDGPWSVDVGADVTNVTVIAEADDANASVELRKDGAEFTGAISDNDNLVQIIVTSSGESKTYELTITKSSDGGDGELLSDISISIGASVDSRRHLYTNFDTPVLEGDPSGFAPEILEYAAVVYGFDTIKISATAQNPGGVTSITFDGENGNYNSATGTAEIDSLFLWRGKGLVTPVEIVVTSTTGQTTTYTVNVKLLNIDEFYRIIYGPPMDKAYTDRWEVIKPGGLRAKGVEIVEGILSGQLDWWVVYDWGVKNKMELSDYHDGQYGFPYNENGIIADGLTIGHLDSKYNGYVLGASVDPKNIPDVVGYQIFLADELRNKGDKIADLDYHLKVVKKDKVTGSDSWTEMVYMGETKRFHYRKIGSDCPVVYPVDEPGFDWFTSWDERADCPCFSNVFDE